MHMYRVRLLQNNELDYPIYYHSKNNKTARRAVADALHRWTTYHIGYVYRCGETNKQDKLIGVISR